MNNSTNAATTRSNVRLSVIAPTYNEAKNVAPLIAALDSALRGIDYEIIISDDDSPDQTWARAEEIGQQNPRVRVLRRMGKKGLGAAVVDGFNFARGQVVACIDADLQHDPSILPQMLKTLEDGCDLVLGSRYVAGGGVSDWGLSRRFSSWTATRLAEWVLGVKLHDPMSGYFMLRREDFLRIQDQLVPEGFKIFLEIFANLNSPNVREIPYVFRKRVSGDSKMSSKVIFTYVSQLRRLSGVRRRVATRSRQTETQHGQVPGSAL